jgi:polysaccharide biosynthesis transport protein
VFRPEYPSVQVLASQITETERLIGQESTRIGDRANHDYQASLRREALIRQAMDQQDAVVRELGRGETGDGNYEALKRDVVTNQAQYSALDQKLKEVTISAALKAANVGIVDRASLVPAPPGSSGPMIFGLSVVIGLLLGSGGMFLREYLDTSMRSVRDVDAYLGLPTLAAIPGTRSRDPGLRTGAALSEAFAALRTAVLLREEIGGSQTLLVTSANAGEGKSVVSVNLAISLARLHHRVLLIDANMRAPVVDRMFGLSSGKSLTDVLAHGEDWRGCVHAAVEENLDVLTAGTSPVSPADLLSLPPMRQLMTVVACEYDFVVIDSPALLDYPADVHALARFAGPVLLTVRQGVTRRESIQLAISQIDRVSGVVLNGSDSIFPNPQGGPRC